MNGREINKSAMQNAIKKLFELTYSTAQAVQKAEDKLDRKQVADITGRLELVKSELKVLINILNSSTNKRTGAQDKIDDIKNIQDSILINIQRILGYDIVKENYPNQDDFRILTISTIPSSSSAEKPADYALKKLSSSVSEILNEYDINNPRIQAKINFNLDFIDESTPAFENEEQFESRILDRQKKIGDVTRNLTETKTQLGTELQKKDDLTAQLATVTDAANKSIIQNNINHQDALIPLLQEQIKAQIEHLNQLQKHQIEDITRRIDHLSDQIEKLTQHREKLRLQITQQQSNLMDIEPTEAEAAEIEREITTLKTGLKEITAQIDSLERKKNELASIRKRFRSATPNDPPPAPPAPPASPTTNAVAHSYKFEDLDKRFTNDVYENYLVSAMHRLGLFFNPQSRQPFGANGTDRLVYTRDTSIIMDLKGNEPIQDEVFSYITPEYEELKKQLLAYKDFLLEQQNQSTDAKEIADINQKLNRVALYLGAVARGLTSITHLQDHLQRHSEQAFYYSKATKIEGVNDKEQLKNAKKKVADILATDTPEPVAVIESGGTVKRNTLRNRSLKDNPVVIESEFLDANNVPIKTAALMHMEKNANNTDKVRMRVFVKDRSELKRLAEIPDQDNLPGDEILKFALSYLQNASAVAGKNLYLNLPDNIIADFPENVNKALFITAAYLHLNLQIQSQNLLPAVSNPEQYLDALEQRLANGDFFADERSAISFATRRTLAREITGQTNFIPYPSRFLVESKTPENNDQQAVSEKPLADLIPSITPREVIYTREELLPFSSKAPTAAPTPKPGSEKGRPTRNILGKLNAAKTSAVQQLYSAWNQNKQKKLTENFNRLAAYDPGFPLEPDTANAQQVFDDILQTLSELSSETETNKVKQVNNYAAAIEKAETEKEQQRLIIELDRYVKTQFPLLFKFGKQIQAFILTEPQLGPTKGADAIADVLTDKDYMRNYVSRHKSTAKATAEKLMEISDMSNILRPLNINSIGEESYYLMSFVSAIHYTIEQLKTKRSEEAAKNAFDEIMQTLNTIFQSPEFETKINEIMNDPTLKIARTSDENDTRLKQIISREQTELPILTTLKTQVGAFFDLEPRFASDTPGHNLDPTVMKNVIEEYLNKYLHDKRMMDKAQIEKFTQNIGELHQEIENYLATCAPPVTALSEYALKIQDENTTLHSFIFNIYDRADRLDQHLTQQNTKKGTHDSPNLRRGSKE